MSHSATWHAQSATGDLRLLSGRAAAQVLGQPRKATLAMMHAGVLGPRYWAGEGVLVTDHAVRAAAIRDHVDSSAVEPLRAVKSGVLVGRLQARCADTDDFDRAWMGVDLFANHDEQERGCDRYFSLARGTVETICSRRTPYVVTVGGMVALGFDAVDVLRTEAGCRLVLEPASHWFAHFERRWLQTPPGGVWAWWHP